MDALSLATTIVGLLVPYLSKVGEAMSKAMVDEAWEKLNSIFKIVKEKFAGDTYAEETLKRIEAEPQSQNRQAALIGVLEEQIKGDQNFANSLRELVDEAKNLGIENISQNVSVSGHARTGDITTIGKVDGNVDLKKKK